MNEQGGVVLFPLVVTQWGKTFSKWKSNLKFVVAAFVCPRTIKFRVLDTLDVKISTPADTIPREIQQAVVSYINGQNPHKMFHKQVQKMLHMQKNVADMIPHEIQRAVVSYINDKNQARMCINFQDALVA